MNRTLLLLAVTISLAGCFGERSRDNTALGQVKRVHHETPMVCLDYDDADISLGVMQNGVGSMSQQDVDFYVPSRSDFDLLQQAALSGKLVRIMYDEARVHWCVEDYTITKVEIVQ
jgi:hypothetical protein